MYSIVVFCLHICLIQYAVSQRVNTPAVNNGLQYGPNGHGSPLQGQALTRLSPELGGVINGPVIGQKGPNQGIGPYGPIMPNAQAFAGAGMPNQVFAGAGLPNQVFAGAGMPNQAFAGAGMPNQAFGGVGIPNQVYGGAGLPNQVYGGPGTPYPAYGGSGNGDVAVTGEVPVAGMTTVAGRVPLTGKVAFSGNVPCGGIVTITGGCSSCGLNAPYAQMPAFGNKPYGY